MKLKLKNGGIVKLQNAATKIPETDWNKFGSGLNIKRLYIPPSESLMIPEKPKSIWDNIKEMFQNAKTMLHREKQIGPLVMAYNKPTIRVENGGNLA